MPVYTTVQIARLWAQTINSSKHLAAWAQGHYSRAWTVSVGEDLRHPPNEADAPLMVIFPDVVSSPERSALHHDIGIVVGIVDDAWETVNGVREMRGLLRLDEIWRLLQPELEIALPGAIIPSNLVEYELGSYPLCMLLITLKVEQSLPVGMRR